MQLFNRRFVDAFYFIFLTIGPIFCLSTSCIIIIPSFWGMEVRSEMEIDA